MITHTRLNNGKIYRIPAGDIAHIGYFYGANGGREDIKSAYNRLTSQRGSPPSFLVNCELFNMTTREAASDIVSNGTVHRLTDGFGIAFSQNIRAEFSYNNSASALDYVGFYPTLLRNGKRAFTRVPQGLSGRRGRTALAVNRAGDLFLALVPNSGGATLSQITTGLISAGATDGGNLDGGASSQWYSPGGVTYTGRALRGFIGIWLK